MTRAENLSLDYLSEIDPTNHNPTKDETNTSDIANKRGILMSIVVGSSFILIAPDKKPNIPISTTGTLDIKEVEQTIEKDNDYVELRQEYLHLEKNENFHQVKNHAEPNTIDAEEILLERELIAEYQSKIKPFIRKSKKKIIF